MKVICDVHIPLKLVTYFNKQGVYAEHVNNLPDTYFTTDKVISEYADKNELVVIMKDVDFRNSYYIKNLPKKLIRICLGNLSTAEMITIMNTHLIFLIDIYQRFTTFYIEVERDRILVLSS